MGGLGGDDGGLRFGEFELRDRGGVRHAAFALQHGQFALDRLDLGRDFADTLGLLARGVLVAVALGGVVGKRGGEVGEDFLGRVELGVGLREAGIDAAATAGAGARLGADGVFLG